MKNSKIVAAMAAAAMAVSMMAVVPASAAEQTLELDGFTLDANDAEGKMCKISFEDLADTIDEGYLKQITFTGTVPDTDEWVNGGGDFGMNYADGWFQQNTSFGFESENCEVDGRSFTVTIDLPAYADIELEDGTTVKSKQDFYTDGVLQFGWWWSASGILEVSDIVLTYETEYPADPDAQPVDDVPTDAETTDAETGDDQPTDAETTDAETTDGETTDSEMLGDVSGDGRIDIRDIVRVAAYVKSLRPLNEVEAKKADANHDGKINVTDVSLIAAHVKGIRPLK